jgi:hypothetical protein
MKFRSSASRRIQSDRAGGVLKPFPMDITLGRGGMANNHAGNKLSREIVAMYHTAFFRAQATTRRNNRGVVVNAVMDHLTREGFRFVEKVEGHWVQAPYAKARLKIIQALREGAFELRKEVSAACSVVPTDGVTGAATTREPEDGGCSGVSVISTESCGRIGGTKSYDEKDSPKLTDLSFVVDASDAWKDVESRELNFGPVADSQLDLEPVPLPLPLNRSTSEDYMALPVDEDFLCDMPHLSFGSVDGSELEPEPLPLMRNNSSSIIGQDCFTLAIDENILSTLMGPSFAIEMDLEPVPVPLALSDFNISKPEDNNAWRSQGIVFTCLPTHAFLPVC